MPTIRPMLMPAFASHARRGRHAGRNFVGFDTFTPRRPPLAMAITAALIALAAPEQATSADIVGGNRTWTGGGSTTNWSNGGNWNGDDDIAKGSSLFFGGTTTLTNVNNLPGGDSRFDQNSPWEVNGLTFNTNAGAFTLNGDPFISKGNITNNSSNRQTLNTPIIVGANQTWSGGAAGLVFGGGISFAAGSSPLTVTGSGNITSRGNITNSSGNLQTLNTHIIVGANQTWSGGAAGLVFGGGISFAAGSSPLTVTGSGSITSRGNITNSSGNLQTLGTVVRVGNAQTWNRGSGGLSVGGVTFVGGLPANALTMSGTGRFTSLGNIDNQGTSAQTIGAPLVVGANQTWTGGSAGLIFNGITFAAGAPAYTVTGVGTIVSMGSITNSSSSLQTIAGTPVVIGAVQSWDTGLYNSGLQVGGLTFGAGLVSNALTLTNQGGVRSTGNITNLSGATQSIANVKLGADQTWNGGTGGLTYNGTTLNLDGYRLSLTNNTHAVVEDLGFRIGFASVASLTLTSGSTLANPYYANVGEFAGGDGSISVGSGSRWILGISPTDTADSHLYIGGAGKGSMRVENGGQVTNSWGFVNQNGAVTITGTGSKWANTYDLTVDAGTIRLDDNATLTNRTATLKNAGSLTVSGAASWTTTQSVRIGERSFGSLVISGDGLVTTPTSFVGHLAGGHGSVTVTGARSVWNSPTLYVGGQNSSAIGEMLIEAGGRVTSNHGRIADATGSTGTVTVSGSGSRWENSSGLTLGLSGVATLNLVSGGVVSTSWLSANSKSTLNFDGGSLVLTGSGSISVANFNVGNAPGSTGSFELLAGKTLGATNEIIGNAGSGVFTQSGGAHNVTTLTLGKSTGGSGTFNLSDGTLNVTALQFAPGGNSTATFNLSGGVLTAGTTMIAMGGQGIFRQTGGTHTVGSLRSGMPDEQHPNGTYHLRGGTLNVGTIGNSYPGFGNPNLYINGGTLNLAAGGGINVDMLSIGDMQGRTGSLAIGNQQSLGSYELWLGGSGTGNLTISGGGSAFTSRAFVSGGGTLTVTGSDPVSGAASSIYLSDYLQVSGPANVEALKIENGATAQLNRVLLSSGTVNVAGANSLLGTGSLEVGWGNGAAANVSAGATVYSTGETWVGINSGSSGALSVTGSGSTLTSSRAIVLGVSGGAGTLVIGDGGLVSGDQRVQVSSASKVSLGTGGRLFTPSVENSGRIEFTGGAATLEANLVARSGSRILATGNSNAVVKGAVEVQGNAEVQIAQGSMITFTGMVNQRNGAVFSGAGDKVYAGGFAVGNSPGLGRDAGSVAFASTNVYEAEIAGTAPGNAQGLGLMFDRYVVAGKLTFGGTLKVVQFNGYVPQAGQSFDLFDWGTSEGQFAAIDFTSAPLANGLAWDTSHLYTNGTLTVAAVPEPSGYIMMLAGMGLMGFMVRRRRAATTTRA